MKRISSLLLSAALTAQPLPAQAPAPPKQEAPAIRTTSRLVQASVIVRDKSGAPVINLTRGDFVLLDNGQPQPVSSFSMGFARVQPAAAAEPLPPNTFTNRLERRGTAPPNVTIILFDALNTLARDHSYGKDQVVRYLRQIRPEDRIALYALSSGGVRVLHDFTADPAALLAAMARYRAREDRYQSKTGPSTQESGMAMFDEAFRSILTRQENFYLRDRVVRTVDAFIAIANHLGKIPGRKNLVWVSGSFPITFGFDQVVAGPAGESAPGTTEVTFAAASDALAAGTPRGGRGAAPPATGGNAGSAPQPIGDPDLRKPPEQGVFTREMERAARALNQAGLAIYPVDARGLVATPPTSDSNAAGKTPARVMTQWAGVDRQTIDSMNLLAERTGGRAFYNTNDIQGSVRQAIDESRVTYELAYYPAHNKWDGAFREISVRVKRPGVEVRHRKGYYAVADRPGEASAQAELDAMAMSPFESSVLSVTARLEPVADAEPGAWNARIELDTREISLEKKDGRWLGALAILLVQKKSDGSTVTSSHQALNLNLEQKTYERLLRDGLKMSKKFTLEPGAEELRIIVRDAPSGTTGSVFVPLNQLAVAK